MKFNFYKEWKEWFDIIPDIYGDLLAGGILEAGDIIEAFMV